MTYSTLAATLNGTAAPQCNSKCQLSEIWYCVGRNQVRQLCLLVWQRSDSLTRLCSVPSPACLTILLACRMARQLAWCNVQQANWLVSTAFAAGSQAAQRQVVQESMSCNSSHCSFLQLADGPPSLLQAIPATSAETTSSCLPTPAMQLLRRRHRRPHWPASRPANLPCPHRPQPQQANDVCSLLAWTTNKYLLKNCHNTTMTIVTVASTSLLFASRL